MRSFRTRTLTATGITLACTIGVLYFSTRTLFLNHLAHYEKDNMAESVNVAKNSISMELEDLSSTVMDWGHWTDSYELMTAGPTVARKYYDYNLTPSALKTLNLDFMLFFDSDGRLVHRALSGYGDPTSAPIPKDLLKTLSPTNPITRYDRQLSSSALVGFGNGKLAMLSTTAIMRSDLAGPPRGTLVFGRYLGQRELLRLRRITGLDLSILRSKDLSKTESHGVNIKTIGKSIRGESVLSIIVGPKGERGTALLRVVRDRAVFMQGSAAMLYFLIPLGITTLLTALVLIFILDKPILRRVDKLNNSLAPFGIDPDKDTSEGMSSIDLAIQGIISMYERSPIGIAVFDTKGATTHANRRLTELTGEKHSISIRSLFNDCDWNDLLAPGHPVRECTWGERTVECLITPLGESVGMYMLQAQDVTDRRSYQMTMEHQARHDALTNLPNRRMFEERFNEFLLEATDGASASVLFMDLDNFKNVNDAMGHQAGDILLQALSTVIGKVSGPDCLVSRIGGDEFIVLDMLGGTKEKAAKLAAKILEAVRQPVFVQGHAIYTTVSIGIALIPADGAESDSIIRRADSALYEAKGSRNCYRFFEVDMEKASQRRLQLKAGLGKALENSELVTFYQPQVDVTSGKVIGVEALVRWQHPTLGMLPPSEFLPLAEELGLINLVDEWVLRTACRQLKLWHNLGFEGLRMSVNLSAKQFLRADLVDSLEQILVETGLEPKDLELEITESTAMFSEALTCDVLERLKGIGIRASLDDFGMGYSNLSYLKQFPLSSLKIPREFVRNTPMAADNVAIVSAVTSMAHSFKLPVVAEGVEMLEELNFISETGCDAVQGYYFSPPKAADAITEYLTKNKDSLIRAEAATAGLEAAVAIEE